MRNKFFTSHQIQDTDVQYVGVKSVILASSWYRCGALPMQEIYSCSWVQRFKGSLQCIIFMFISTKSSSSFLPEAGFFHDWPARGRQLVAEGHQESGWKQRFGHSPGRMIILSCYVIGMVHIHDLVINLSCDVAEAGSAAVHSGTESFHERGAAGRPIGHPATRRRSRAGEDEERRVPVSAVWGLQVSGDSFYSAYLSFCLFAQTLDVM